MTPGDERKKTRELFKRYHRFVANRHTYEHDIRGDKSYFLIRDLLAHLAKSHRRSQALEEEVKELTHRLRMVEIDVEYLESQK